MKNPKILVLILIAVFSINCLTTNVEAATTIKHIARLKGQEEVTIQGMGLVVGLNGTGDGGSFAPAIRGLAAMLQRMHSPLGDQQLKELKDAKNVALVMVSATIPATGARQGDLLEVNVSSIGAAKSLEHGVLLTTVLLSPQAGNDRIYALAQGYVQLDNPKAKTVARIRQGCRLEEDFRNEFVKDGKITIVLDKNHADFQVAQEISEVINNSPLTLQTRNGNLARALDQVNIEVTIPQQKNDDIVEFVAQIMGLRILEPQTGGRVVINERTGSIVISGDVEIGAVAVTHKNLVIQSQGQSNANPLLGVETSAKSVSNSKMQNLISALTNLHVSAEDQISIIKAIDRDGKLHGTLIIE